jgi:hypothetical protein
MADADLIAPIRVAAPKPRMTVYYAMLILSLLAMLTACGFLYAEIRRFGGFGTVPQRISSTVGKNAYLCQGLEIRMQNAKCSMQNEKC